MEIKIDLDLNKIDYDAINKQIVEKIAEMDLTTNYNFKYKIVNKIDEEVGRTVDEYFRSRRWGDLNDRSRQDMNEMLYSKTKALIEPHVSNIIRQIPQEEMDKIIMDLIPKVLVDLLSRSLKDTLINYWTISSENIIAEASNRIRSSRDY